MLAKRPLGVSRRIIEQADLRASDLTVDSRREGVDSNVDDAAAVARTLVDPRLDGVSMRKVVAIEQSGAIGGIELSGKLRK